MKQEFYCSVDVEATGMIPGDYSMLSIGCVAYSHLLEEIGTFSANLEELQDAGRSKETMDWWLTQQDAWNICRVNQERPIDAMKRFSQWLHDIPGQPIFVGTPLGFDFTFITWYFEHFLNFNPFTHAGIDLKTLAMAVLKKPYKKINKKKLYQRWPSITKHTHCALDDAREQGEIFCGIMKELNIYATKEDK
jgi:DNA polymerase III alpha subunit (gram-positive type)